MHDLLTGFVIDFKDRFDGPFHFRFIFQPLMAILFASRDGIRDAREGRSAYGWALLTDPNQRRYLLADGWKGISKVFLVACVLDIGYELIEWHDLKLLQTLLVAAILAVIPYVLVRGPVNRLWRLRRSPQR